MGSESPGGEMRGDGNHAGRGEACLVVRVATGRKVEGVRSGLGFGINALLPGARCLRLGRGSVIRSFQSHNVPRPSFERVMYHVIGAASMYRSKLFECTNYRVPSPFGLYNCPSSMGGTELYNKFRPMEGHFQVNTG